MNAIAERRKAHKYTQQELADLCECRRETIANLEKSRYNASLALADRVACVLGCTIYDLFPELGSAVYHSAELEQAKETTRNKTLEAVQKLADAMQG